MPMEPKRITSTFRRTAPGILIQGHQRRIRAGDTRYSLYDGVITVRSDDAFEASLEFAVKKGVLVGISSGRPYGQRLNAKKDENKIRFSPDSGDRYLSTELY